MRPLTVIGAVLLMSVAFAGCHEPDPTDDPDDLTLTLSVLDPPETVPTGQGFNLSAQVDVDQEVTSTHSGFHWGFNSSAGLDPADYTTALTDISPHLLTEHTHPGVYTVEDWVFEPEHAGRTVYYRAHTIVDETHHWSDEHSFELE